MSGIFSTERVVSDSRCHCPTFDRIAMALAEVDAADAADSCLCEFVAAWTIVVDPTASAWPDGGRQQESIGRTLGSDRSSFPSGRGTPGPARRRGQKISAKRPITTSSPIRKMTPTVPPMNFSILAPHFFPRRASLASPRPFWALPSA